MRPDLEDIVDEQHVAAGDVALDVAEDPHLARRHRPGAVARQRQELHLGRDAGRVEGAQKIGGEDEAALQDGDHEQVGVARGGDLVRQFVVAGGDRSGIVEDADGAATDDRHQRIPIATPVRPTKLKATRSPPGKGLASAERKPSDAPASSSAAAGSTSQE